MYVLFVSLLSYFNIIWQSLRLEIKGSLFLDSLEALHCVIEQDTLSAAYNLVRFAFR